MSKWNQIRKLCLSFGRKDVMIMFWLRAVYVGFGRYGPSSWRLATSLGPFGSQVGYMPLWTFGSQVGFGHRFGYMLQLTDRSQVWLRAKWTDGSQIWLRAVMDRRGRFCYGRRFGYGHRFGYGRMFGYGCRLMGLWVGMLWNAKVKEW